MNGAAAHKPIARPAAVEVFRLRCISRARLWASGEIDLDVAVDELQESAVASGLVELVGQDEVQFIMAEAFGAVRDDLRPSGSELADDAWSAPSWREAASDYHKERAGRTLIVEIEPDRLARLRELMADDVSLERAYAELSKPAGVAGSTLEAAEYVASKLNPKHFRDWLARYGVREQEQILKHLKRKGTREK